MKFSTSTKYVKRLSKTGHLSKCKPSKEPLVSAGRITPGKLQGNEGLAAFIRLSLPVITWGTAGPTCIYCKKALAFLNDLNAEIFEIFFTLNTTCYEDRLKEKLTLRCRKCGGCFDWYFAAQLHESLDGASVHVDRVRKKDPDIVKRG